MNEQKEHEKQQDKTHPEDLRSLCKLNWLMSDNFVMSEILTQLCPETEGPFELGLQYCNLDPLNNCHLYCW